MSNVLPSFFATMPPKKPAPPTLGPAAALIGSDCDSDYDSADDSDFDPSSAAAAAAAPGDDDDSDLSASSSDEGDAGAKHAPGPRKRKRALSTSSETASGGMIQTRAQRALGAKSDRPQAARLPSGAVTTDVDALWAEMNSSSAAASARPGPSTATTTAATSTATPVPPEVEHVVHLPESIHPTSYSISSSSSSLSSLSSSATPPPSVPLVSNTEAPVGYGTPQVKDRIRDLKTRF